MTALTRLRRLAYVPQLDPESTAYNDGRSEEAHGGQSRVWCDDGFDPDKFDVPVPNVVSSMARDETLRLSDFHYPCFDVDVPLTEDDLAVLYAMFPFAYGIPSRTEGHTHWYSSQAQRRLAYFDNLQVLADRGLIEEGYMAASDARGCTFLRLPTVVGVRL
jgi:hypothetical protein